MLVLVGERCRLELLYLLRAQAEVDFHLLRELDSCAVPRLYQERDRQGGGHTPFAHLVVSGGKGNEPCPVRAVQ